MKTYFLKNGTRESGPFMLDDLKYQRISPSSMIKEGNGEWELITQNRDLRFLLEMNGGESTFSNSQTASTNQSQAADFKTIQSNSDTQLQNSTKSRLMIIIALVLFFVVAGVTFAVISMNASR